MMEQNESIDFRSLKARFQGENNLKIPTKPVIPEKPKSVPPLPAKVSNPLISSINSAVNKGTFHAPRVVFKDDKNLNLQLSPTWGNGLQPASNSELLDNNQKRQGDIPKKHIKDRNLPLVLPVPPIKAKIPQPETSLSVSPAKVSTPKKFVFKPIKTGKDVKTDTLENQTSSAEPSPLSVSPARVSTPKTSVFNTTNAVKDTVENPKPALRTFDYSPPSHPALANPSITANAPSASVPVVPKALVPPQISAGEHPIPSISASSIPAPHIPTSPSPEPKIPEQVIPKPAIRSQAVRKPEVTKTETPTKPNINLLSLSEVFPPPQESPPPDFTDIPPPIFADEDFPDEVFFDQTIPRSRVTPVSMSPTVSRKSSPAPPTHSTISPELLLRTYTSLPGSVATPSPPPAVHTPTAPKEESAKALTDKKEVNKENQTPPKSPLSFLARAEEMSPVKRTTPLDNRVYNLLEKAKRMSTPEKTYSYKMDAPTVALSDTFTPDVAHSDLGPTEKALPQIPTAVPGDASAVPERFDFPPADYVDSAHVPPKSHLPETVQVNGLDPRQLSPGFVTVVKPVNPPAPPVRKPLPAIPIVMTPPMKRKSPSEHLQIPTTPAQHLEENDEQPYDNSFEESFEDTEEFETPPVPNFRPIPPLVSGLRRPTSVHDKAFMEQWDPKHQAAGEMLPNTNYRDSEVDFGSLNSSSPQPGTHASLLQDHVQSSPVSQGVLSLSGGNVYEDLSVSKKSKNVKNKKQKGPPKNPYADAAATVDETPKKGLFSRKNSAKVADEKELKKKEKQREKEKEKEKERERKEQKEKEKKENEIKKKFKITGQEEPIYHVKVIEDCKGSKNDLPVRVGETVSIIRTTSCPKGKWLAKDSSNRYGYVPVESMDLNIDGIVELGKMTTATNRPIGNGVRDGEHTSTGSRTSDHYAMNNESFSDYSEEWTCDDDDPAYGSPSEAAHIGLNQTPATPARVSEPGPVHQTQTDGNYTNVHAKHEALQKLSTFFTQPKTPSKPPLINNAPTMEMPKPDYPGHLNQEEEDLDIPYFHILPPPDLYADIIAGDSVPIYSKPIKTSTK